MMVEVAGASPEGFVGEALRHYRCCAYPEIVKVVDSGWKISFNYFDR